MSKMLESTAYHEAGHAVAAYDVRLRTKALSIVPNDGENTLGHHIGRPYFTGMPHPDISEIPPRMWRRLEHRAMVCLAGPAAQRRFNPSGFRHSHAQGDYHQAVDFLSYLSGSNEAVEAHLHLVELRAKELIEADIHWAEIEALAAALLERKELSSTEVRQIIEESGRLYINQGAMAVKNATT
jgi:hypothetical protein